MQRHLVKRLLIGLVALSSVSFGVYALGLVTLSLLRGTVHVATLQQLSAFLLALMLEGMLIWMGIRGLKLASGAVSLTEPRVKIWRIFLGVGLLYGVIKDIFDPGSRSFPPTNEGQAQGYRIAIVLFVVLAIWLIASALRSLKHLKAADIEPVPRHE